MATETEISELRAALSSLYLAGIHMPRHTPASGAACTEHTYQLSAAEVWKQDIAMKKAALVLDITDLPPACCVGNNGFDPVLAEGVYTRTQRILARST